MVKSSLNFLRYQESVVKSLVFLMRTRKSILPTPNKKTFKPQTMMIEVAVKLEECRLEKYFKKYCVICEKTGVKKKQTTFYCSLHDKSVCIIPCYDIHRQNLEI